MQLILHAPFGGRINKAWGLALRKRFCRGFNFELQAAATDNGINICLAEQHSFPLSDVFQFLTENTAKELLEQAAIASPIFKTRWRWAAGRRCNCCACRRASASRHRSSARVPTICWPASFLRLRRALKISWATSRFPTTRWSTR